MKTPLKKTIETVEAIPIEEIREALKQKILEGFETIPSDLLELKNTCLQVASMIVDEYWRTDPRVNMGADSPKLAQTENMREVLAHKIEYLHQLTGEVDTDSRMKERE